MSKQQSNPEVSFEDIMLETAWKEVESTFHAAGEVAPLPGFSARWMERLELARQREERMQATALIIGNLVIAIGFIILIGLQFVPAVSSGGVVELWVDLLSRLVITVRMAAGLAETFIRTLPGLIPTSWLISGLALVGILIAIWASVARRHIVRQGVEHEEN